MALVRENLKVGIPWGMAVGRAALGPVLIAGARCLWNPMALAGVVVAALVSDIFDGVLARRWGTDSAAVRLFDSMADTVFYLCAAVALWMSRPEVLRSNRALLGVLLGLEVLRFGFDVAKFGKMASYHSYLAKTWGLVMAVAVTAVFATGRANVLVPVALGLGVLCNVEGLAMSMVLRVWRRDVKWIGAAWRIRQAQGSKLALTARKAVAAAVIVASMLCVAAPAFAVGAGETAYAGGTAAGIAKGTLGTLDTVSPERLAFRTSFAAGSGSEVDIAYSAIRSFQYSTEVVHPLGVLPLIAVSLVKRRERRHLFTITYADASGSTQVAIFEVSKGEPQTLLAILRARAAQACGKLAVNYCGGNLGDANGW